ncbi:MAG: sulfotransferase [Caldilineaceae bacterium]
MSTAHSFHQREGKETQYFLHFQHHDLPEDAIKVYQQAFASPPGAICGEFSTQYLAYPACLEHIAEAAADTKLIVILRNPIDRFISHVNHLIGKRGRRLFADATKKQRYLLHNFSFHTEAVLHSLYSVGLARLYRYFGEDQVLVLQYENLIKDPQAQIALAYQFLGVDSRFRVRGGQKVINKGNYAIAKPEQAERERLTAYFADDVKRTFALCPDLDPNMWPDFAFLAHDSH